MIPDLETVTIQNSFGCKAIISTYGGRLLNFWIPNKNGELIDIIVGCGDAHGVLNDRHFMGAVVGPWANRIRNGFYKCNGQPFQLEVNEKKHHLHGASAGYENKVWKVTQKGGDFVELSYCHPEGLAGFQSNISNTVIYKLNELELEIIIQAQTDKPIPFNATVHPYINLNPKNKTIEPLVLTIHSDLFMPIDDDGIANGTKPVKDTAFDFNQGKENIGYHLSNQDKQLGLTGGFDHCFIIKGSGYRAHARLVDPEQGTTLEIWSNQPALQFYSAHKLESDPGKDGLNTPLRGLCLEPQRPPDCINQPDLGINAFLHPGELYEHKLAFRFDTNNSN